jgi:chemotaxis protein MotB
MTRAIQKEEIIMQAFKTAIVATSLVALAGCASWDKSPICYDRHGWQAWPDVRCVADNAPKEDAAARLAALEKERQRLADELATAQKQNGTLSSRVSDLERQLADRDREIASLRSDAGDSAKLASQLAAANSDKNKTAADLATAKQRTADLEAQLAAMGGVAGDKDTLAAELATAKQRVADLEKQLADRDKELAELRGDLSTEMAKLKEAQRGLIRALRPQIDKKNIAIDLNNERLLINLASGYLFGSGEDQLKPAGADALKQVGAILKDFPEYKVHVEGHTDNRPILGALKKKFPSNKELSEARAANAVQALTDGGLSGAHPMGASDTKPVMPNTTDAGRAKNRRVEISVTK